MRLELADDLVGVAATELELVERLDRGEPGGASLAGARCPAPGGR